MRSEIQRLVSAIRPFDAQEAEHIAFIQQWIASGVEIFRIEKPAVPDTHLVSYIVLIDQATNKVLLVDHKKAEAWLPAGGHVDPNEHPKLTAQRELMEELGIQAEFISDEPVFVTVTQTTGKQTKHTDVSLWYVLKGSASETLNFDPREFHAIQWFSPSEIPYPHTDVNMSRFIDKVSQLKLLSSRI